MENFYTVNKLLWRQIRKQIDIGPMVILPVEVNRLCRTLRPLRHHL